VGTGLVHELVEMHTIPVISSLEDLIESVLFFYETEVGMRKIDLQNRYREAPPVLCQPGEFHQVITNLVGNALDALSRHGRLIVGVRPSSDRDGRKGVVVIVADSGSGMDREMRDRLFLPFATTKGDAGTGLGLWVSKGIRDKHNTKISVRSKRGCGTVFRLFVPLEAMADESLS
jgi:signal transduction histidine kinase